VPILGNYVVRTILGYTALVMLVLLALGALFLFIGQQTTSAPAATPRRRRCCLWR